MTYLDIYHLFLKTPATSDLVPIVFGPRTQYVESRLICLYSTYNSFHPKDQHIMKVHTLRRQSKSTHCRPNSTQNLEEFVSYICICFLDRCLGIEKKVRGSNLGGQISGNQLCCSKQTGRHFRMFAPSTHVWKISSIL